MMTKNDNFYTVARGVRIEIDPVNNDMYIVFKVIDESFRQKVRENWKDDIPIVMIGTDLVEK